MLRKQNVTAHILQLSGVERRKTEVTNSSILKIENSSMLKKCIGNFEILICIKIQLNISGNETQALKEYLKWLRARRPPVRAKT